MIPIIPDLDSALIYVLGIFVDFHDGVIPLDAGTNDNALDLAAAQWKTNFNRIVLAISFEF